MVMINVSVKGIEKVDGYLKRMTARMPAEVAKLRNSISNEIYLAMLSRAPMDTGFLKRNIKISYSNKENKISISNVPYAMPQETGFTPHLIPIQYIEMHKGTPGVRGQFISDAGPFVWVSRAPRMGFIKQSVDKAIVNLKRKATKTAKEIVKK